jgi:acetylornithine deacetylase
MGVAPDEMMESAQKEMENCLAQLSKYDSWFLENPPLVEWFGARWLPGNIEEGHPLQKVLSESFRDVKKEDPIIEASPWGTDGGILSNVGNIPVVVFGPGITELAHDANEHIVLEEMLQASEIIALTIMRWCEPAK